jgi:hypothetical protein
MLSSSATLTSSQMITPMLSSGQIIIPNVEENVIILPDDTMPLLGNYISGWTVTLP